MTEAVRAQRELDLREHVFTLEGGMVIQDGKSYHRDLARGRLRENWRVAEAAGGGLSDEEIDREINQVRVVLQRRKSK
jgi:hypothetical protein